LFIEEKELLAGGKDEIASAIGTFENFVDEIHPASLAFVPKHPFKQRETDGAPGSPGILAVPACCDTPIVTGRGTPDCVRGPGGSRRTAASQDDIPEGPALQPPAAMRCGEEQHRQSRKCPSGGTDYKVRNGRSDHSGR